MADDEYRSGKVITNPVEQARIAEELEAQRIRGAQVAPAARRATPATQLS